MFRWCSAGKSSAIRPLQSRPLASYHPRPPPQPTAPIYCCPSIPSAKENITFHIADTGGIFRPTGTPISSYRCHLPSFHSQNKLYVDQGAKKHSKLKLEGRQREREKKKYHSLSIEGSALGHKEKALLPSSTPLLSLCWLGAPLWFCSTSSYPTPKSPPPNLRPHEWQKHHTRCPELHPEIAHVLPDAGGVITIHCRTGRVHATDNATNSK